MAATADTAKTPPAPAKKKSSLKWPLLVLVVCALAGGAWYAGHKSQAATEKPAPAQQAKAPPVNTTPIFVALDPAFVVNLAGADAQHFLQVNVQVVTHKSQVADAIKKLEPDLRNRLVLLFSSQQAANLGTRQDKERLQKEALKEVKAGLAQFHEPTDVDAVIFTSFVMQ